MEKECWVSGGRCVAVVLGSGQGQLPRGESKTRRRAWAWVPKKERWHRSNHTHTPGVSRRLTGLSMRTKGQQGE